MRKPVQRRSAVDPRPGASGHVRERGLEATVRAMCEAMRPDTTDSHERHRAARRSWLAVAGAIARSLGWTDGHFATLACETCPLDAWRADADSAIASAPHVDAGEAQDIASALEFARAWRSTSQRKRDGGFFTPVPIARYVLAHGMPDERSGASHAHVLDPSVGGGRFLLEALGSIAADRLYGIDVDPECVWATRIAIGVASRLDASTLIENVVVGDALSDEFAWPCVPDVIVGNPPWVAFKGRQAQPMPEASRTDLQSRFRSFAGFPSTHGMFIERCCARVADGGRVSLLVPTQVSDLDGYRATRTAATERCVVLEPLEDLGFERFRAVVGPTLLFRAQQSSSARASSAAWRVEGAQSRDRLALDARALAVVSLLSTLPKIAPETFGEAGFQTAGDLASTHLARFPTADPRFSVPLREGRDIEPFFVGPPSRALDPDATALAEAGTRLRSRDTYDRVRIVIRQTARYPIAAVHEPALAFRNSLLAAYTDDPLVLVALLNSRLMRAYHVATQRDARQTVFPQLKISHLRALPAPPGSLRVDALRALARQAADAQSTRRRIAAAMAVRWGVNPDVAEKSLRPVGFRVPDRFARFAPQVAPSVSRLDAREAFEFARARTDEAIDVYRGACTAIDHVVEDAFGVAADDAESLARATGVGLEGRADRSIADEGAAAVESSGLAEVRA